MFSYLLYGDYITINSSFLSKQNTKVEGSLSAKGIFDSHVYFQTHPLNEKELSQISVTTNHRDMVFQVWPFISFQASKLLGKLEAQKQLIKIKQANNPQGDQFKFQESLLELEVDLQKCQERIKAEKEYNQKTFDLNFGYNVTYGTDIFLLHVDSYSYLSSKIITSQVDRSAFKFELSDQLKSGMVFRFLPKFKLRQFGENIQYSDQLLIMNVKLHCYINFSTDAPMPFDQDLANDKAAKPFKPYYKPIRTKRIDAKSQRFEAFLSQFSDFQWQIKPHGHEARSKQELKLIKGGDIIRLRNTETTADLTATINFNLENSELYMRSYTGEYLLEKETVNSLFEIELDEDEVIRGLDCSYIDEKSITVPHFRLRHFITGYLLGYQETDGKKIPVLLPNTSKELQDKSLIEVSFIPTVQRDSTFLRNYGVYQIEFNGGLFLTVDSSRKLNREDCIRKGENEEVFVPLTDAEMSIKRTALSLKPINSEENAFQIIRVTQEEKNLILRLSSSLPFLTYLRDVFRYQIRNEDFLDVCKLALKVLTNLIFFMLKTEGSDPLECEGIPIQEHQKLFRDMKMIEILVDLLYFPFRNHIYELKDLVVVPEDLIKIFTLSYRLIKFSIKEYRPNELYASQWLGLFMVQTLYADSRVDIMAEPTLTELIDNNRIVLETKITKETKKSFVDLIMKTPLKKYVKLLRAVCVCDNQPMIVSQGEISLLILNNEEARAKIVFPLRNRLNIVDIMVSGEWIDLLSFQKNKESIEYEFFLSVIELMADLCLNKNFLAINVLKDIYTFEICFLLISNKKYEPEIRAAFVRLIVTLWIEAEGDILQPLSSIRTWEEIAGENQTKLICIDKDIKIYDRLKGFINEFLVLVVSEEYMKGFEKDKNLLTFQILSLLKTITLCGFFKSIEEINVFSPSLLAILNSVHDVMDIDENEIMKGRLEKLKKKKEKIFSIRKKSIKSQRGKAEIKRFFTRYSPNPESLIIMECKEVICDILKVFFDLRTNIRITAFMQEFRKEFEHMIQLTENSQNINSNMKNDENQIQMLSAFLKKSTGFLKKIGIQEEENLKKNNIDVFQYIENPLSWVNSLLQRKSIEIVEAAPVNLTALLLDLTLYDHPELVNKAFELLYKLNSESRSVLEAVREIQLLENQDQVKAFVEIKVQKEKLQELADASEIWYELKDQSSINQHQNTVHILQELIKLLELKFDEIDPRESLKEPENDEIPASKEEKLLLNTENPNEASLILNYSVNKDRQELMRNLNIAEPVINLIKYDVKVSEDEHPSKLILIKLCYKFLAGFCHGNLKNQNLIEVEFDNFLQHMLKTPNSDAQLLIIELFYNNKRLLFNSEKIDRVFETFCLVLEKSETLSLKEYLMNSLQTFLKYKSAAIKINQTKLVTAMGSNNYKKILNSIESDDQLLEEFIKRITKFQDQIDQKLKENSSNIIDLPADIGYFSQQLLILSLVSEEKNYAAESRCQYFFPLEVLKKLLENTKNMWYIRKYLVFFLYNVYFETEKEMNETQNVINHLIKLIVEDFEILASEIDDSKLLSLRTFRGKTSIYNTQLDYLNLSLLPCLNLIFKMNLISSANIMDIYKRSIEALIVLGNKNLQNNLIRANLSNFLTVLLKKRTIINNLNYNEKYKNSIPSNLLKEKKIAMALKKSYTHMENTHQNMEISSKSDKFRKRLDQTIKSRTYLTKVEHEFESLVENIVNIELLTQKTFFNLCNIGYQELCTSLLKLIDPTDMTLSMDLTIVGLTVFRKIIERENTDKQTCSADWTSNDFQAYSKKIEIRQNELCNFGLVEVIGNMIGNESLSRQLKNEAILVGISMLMGGNSKVQDRFFKYLEGEDSKNLLLVNLKEMLEDDFQKIKKVMDAKNKGYLEKILEIQAEIAEKKEKTMIINPENSSALTKEKARTSKKKKTFNEEEQELLEKEEEEKRTLSSKTKEIESNEEEEDESERTEIQEKIQNCTRIFRLLQLFCEGHKSEMQNHLRVQIQHKIIHAKTQNFITDSSYKFGSLIKFVNINCTCLLNQIIDFLIEAIQGPCVQNQMELSKAKIVEFVKDLLSTFIRPNDYLKRGFLDSDEQGNINSIVTKSSNLLIALIEGNTTDEILKDLCTRLDFRFMRQVLAKEYEAFLTNNLGLNRPFPDVEDVNSLMKFDKYEGNIAEAFNLFLLIKTIAINLASKDRESKNSAQYALESDPEDNPLANQALEFFDSNVLSIEIMFHEKLHRIFFPIEPVCRNLSRETRRILMAEVKRDSPNEKISGLLAASSALFNEMEHMTYLKTWRLSFTAARLSFFRDLSTLLAFFLNILMLATFYREIQTDTGQQDFSKVHSVIREGGIENTPDGNNINILLWVFGVIQVCTSGLMLLFWIILYSKLVIKTKWGELVQENKQTMLNNNYEEELEEDDAFEMENIDNQFAQYLLYTKGPDSKFFRKDGKRNFGTNFLKFHYYIKSMVMLLSAPGLLYSVFYIVVSLFGLLLSPLFYCYHLLDIVSRFETLKNVIRSVTRNANQLLLTLFLGLVILYMFTILMFFFLFDAYYDESINSDESLGQNTCSTMFQCYLTTVNYGFRNGGGFGDRVINESYDSENRGRFFLSFSIKIIAWVLINIIFLNIIFGIIIDTFAELRDEKSRIDEDMKNICFICGLDRYDFEKSGDGFDAHIDNDHRLWNYIYYIYYLKSKDETDYSGIESDIAAKIEVDDNSWFPMMKAMILGEGEKKVIVGDLINEKVGELKNKLDEITLIYDQKVKGLEKKK